MKYSVIIPVYNRPDECDELLASLDQQTMKDFEVIVVEDGSAVPCEEVVQRYVDRLDVHYFSKPNSGPGQTRNYGVDCARGEYVLILDSDAVLPATYVECVEAELFPNGRGGRWTVDGKEEPTEGASCEAFGGPDRAHESFTPIQKAINYGMTSFFTTGGIRGGKATQKGQKSGGAKMDRFFPRSFNMGVRRDIYQQLGGFSKMRFGEDVDFSYRLVESGARCRLFSSAWVYHKRRANFRQFFKQVHNSGIARINLTKRHPGTLKLVHLLPMVFTLGVGFCLLWTLIGLLWAGYDTLELLLCSTSCDATQSDALLSTPLADARNAKLLVASFGLLPLLLYALLICVDSTLSNKSLKVGILSIAAAFIQLIGYGTGFLRCWWQRCILGRGEFEAFKKNFYK